MYGFLLSILQSIPFSANTNEAQSRCRAYSNYQQGHFQQILMINKKALAGRFTRRHNECFSLISVLKICGKVWGFLFAIADIVNTYTILTHQQHIMKIGSYQSHQNTKNCLLKILFASRMSNPFYCIVPGSDRH